MIFKGFLSALRSMIMISQHASNKQRPPTASSSLSPQQVIPVEVWVENFKTLYKIEVWVNKSDFGHQNNFGQPFFSNVPSDLIFECSKICSLSQSIWSPRCKFQGKFLSPITPYGPFGQGHRPLLHTWDPYLISITYL